VDEEELKIAHSPFSFFQGYIPRHLDGFKIAPITYNGAVAPFDEVCDLFNDGSVLVIRTPGHTPGHVSVVLNMQSGPTLLTFDAAHRRANIEEGIPTKGIYEQGLDSIRRLQSFVKEFPAMNVIFGHDPDQIGSLKVSQDYYS
jgi:glyoxylase-like metal-dependent hydrolase (beta-lactamase superfamily II)